LLKSKNPKIQKNKIEIKNDAERVINE